MFRNVESHFSQVPRNDIQRSIFDRPKTRKMSGDIGRLYPIYCDIAYPGDTIKMTTSKVIRLQTLLTPIMDDMYADFYWFKVPLRLVWDHWKEFMGENSQSAWIPQVTYQIPTISAPATTGFAVGTIADHLELPVGVPWTNSMKHVPMALPFRAYALICNEWFRDENLTDPLNIPTGDSNQTGTNGDSYINDVANGGMPFKVAKYHDYWTSMLPSSQKGNSVTFPLISGSLAPVATMSTDITPKTGFGDNGLYWKNSSNTTIPYHSAAHNIVGYVNADGTKMLTDVVQSSTSVGEISSIYPSNLWADISSTVGAVTVNQLRLAFQLQRYYEALARSGSRYTEVIKGLFNVDSPDGRLQRPEYLGGNRVPVQVHEVTNQAQSSQDFLGDLGAMSRTSDVHADFVTSCTEHCVIMGLMCLRYSHSYPQGFDPYWLRTTTTSWYFPQFANVGEMPTYTCNLYATTSTMDSDDVFGYQEAWADMRYSVSNSCTGEMRPGVSNTLAAWHLADYYQSQPYLSDSWIREDKTNVDRVLAVTSANANQFFADIYFDSRWTRPMPMFSVPGLIDHH